MPDDDELSASIYAFMNRRRYADFDRATLASISNDDLELAIQDYVYARIGDDSANEDARLAELSPGFRAVFTTLCVEAEVRNGGFNQYFWNSEGKLADLAVEGFRHIGAPEYADLMKRAIATWRDENDVIEPFREVGTIEAFSESYEHSKLGDLDHEFYELVKVSDLSHLRIAFIRTHEHEFITTKADRQPNSA